MNFSRRALLSAVALSGVTTLAACGNSSSGGASASSTTSASAGNASASGSTATATASAATSGSATPSASASASKAVKKTALTSLDQITVSTGFGKTPVVKAPYPFSVTKTMSKVLVAGKGVAITKSSDITMNYDGINATSGKSFDSSFAKGRTAYTSPVGMFVPGFTKSLIGKHVGDRVLMVIPPADGYGTTGASTVGISGTDTIMFVVDIVAGSLSGPTGAAITPAAGLPTVGKDAKGYPTVTIDTSKAAPTSDVVQPLTAGTGAAVKTGQTVQVNYRAWSWKTGKMVQSDYEGGPEEGVLSNLPTSWQKGLLGKKIGQRVMIIDYDAYPNGNATPSFAAGDTIVYIIDILNAYTAAS